MSIVTAYCWANGVIEFGPKCPKGALPLARGEARMLDRHVDVLATHSYNGVTRLVPKSLEWCDGDMQAAVADVARFAKRLEDSIAKEEEALMSKRLWTVEINLGSTTVDNIEAATEQEAITKALDAIYDDPIYYIDLDPADRFAFDAYPEDDEEQPA